MESFYTVNWGRLGREYTKQGRHRTTVKEPSESSGTLLGGLLPYILKSQWDVGRKLGLYWGRCFGGSTKGKERSHLFEKYQQRGVEAARTLLATALPLCSIPAWGLCIRPVFSPWYECIWHPCSIANTLLGHLQIWVVINELPWACYTYLSRIAWKLTPPSFSPSLGSLSSDSHCCGHTGILWVASKQISIKLYL